MKRHRVTRHCKSGKCVTYWRGKEGSRRFGEGKEFEFLKTEINGDPCEIYIQKAI